MSKTVRVLFWYSSTENRGTDSDVAAMMERFSSEGRSFINEEWRKAERLLRSGLAALFGDTIVTKDIIQAVLDLRTLEGLAALEGKLVVVYDNDCHQVMRLVNEYRLPTGGDEFQVVFIESQINGKMNFHTRVMRDTNEPKESEVPA